MADQVVKRNGWLADEQYFERHPERKGQTICAFCDEEMEARVGDDGPLVCWRHFTMICEGESK